MAKARRTYIPKGRKRRRADRDDDDGDIVFPKEDEEPVSNFNDFSILIHGEKKIGKTTLSLQGARTLILQFDPPQKAYRRMEIVIEDWKHFKKVLRGLEDGMLEKRGYERVVIDRADVCYQMCFKAICDKLAIEYPNDEGYGKGWDAIRREFTDVVDRFLRLPCGRWFLCHSEWREIETREGNEISKLLPVLSKQAESVLNGKVDLWMAYDYVGSDRVLIVRGDEATGAGNRMDQEEYPHFRTPDGEPVYEIPCGSNERETYENLIAAFDNEQETTHAERKEKKRKKKRRN